MKISKQLALIALLASAQAVIAMEEDNEENMAGQMVAGRLRPASERVYRPVSPERAARERESMYMKDLYQRTEDYAAELHLGLGTGQTQLNNLITYLEALEQDLQVARAKYPNADLAPIKRSIFRKYSDFEKAHRWMFSDERFRAKIGKVEELIKIAL